MLQTKRTEQPPNPKENNRGTGAPREVLLLLTPAALTSGILFGGGLLLGALQALGYSPNTAVSSLTLAHVTSVLKDPDLIHSFVLTFYIAGMSTGIAAIVSVLLAVVLQKYAETNRTVHFLLQIPLTVPHLAVAIAMLLLLAPAGFLSRGLVGLGVIDNPTAFPLLVNDRFSVAIILTYIWKEIPFITLMLLSVLKNSGTEMCEVAATLGAGRVKRFFYVTLPTLRPSLTGGCFIVFAYTFGAFEVPYLLGQTYPLPLPVWAYKNFSDVDLLSRPEGITIGLIITAIVAVFILCAQFLLRSGRRGGAAQ